MSTGFDGFTGEVQHRIDASNRAEAVRTTRAVLETVGERLEEGMATDIAGPLPMEIDRYLLQVENGQKFDYQEFVERVLKRLAYEDLDLEIGYGKPAEVDRSDAVFRIKAVIDLLNDKVRGGEIVNLESQLPDEYAGIFEFIDSEKKPWES